MKNTLLLTLFVGLFALFQSTSLVAWAIPNQWTNNGQDDGIRWSPANTRLPPSPYVQAMVIDPVKSTTLYAVTQVGVFKSIDGGGKWSSANTGLPLPGTAVESLAIDPDNPATLYAGTDGDGVFKSTDGGGSWSPSNTGLPAALRFVYALAIDSARPNTIYAGTVGTRQAFGGSGVFKSIDGGGSWSRTNTDSLGDVKALAIDPVNPTTLYAGAVNVYISSFPGHGGGLFKSTDGGATWVNTGLPVAIGYSQFPEGVKTLAIDPANPSTLYAGTYDGKVFKSIDGGEIWSSANTGLPLPRTTVESLAIDPVNPSTLYAGTDGGIFKSHDGGRSWGNVGLPTTASVYALAIDPANPATLYAGTAGDGVFKSFVLSSAECLFNWAERNYPALFAPSGTPSAIWGVYTYRYYSPNNTYLGVSSIDNHVYYMGPDGNLQSEGPLSDWLPKASCQFFAQAPIECLFNWAEINYPALLAPSGSPTAIWGVYTYRYYSANDTFLGVSSLDNHVYYMGLDKNLLDQGLLSYWLPRAGWAGCQ